MGRAMRIFCDFDGTISTVDTTDLVLTSLADPAWEDLEARWIGGEIGAAQCMREQIALIGGDDAALDAVLARVEITAGFHEFVAWSQARDAPLSIISDGVDDFIGRVLQRHGLEDLPVIANRLTGDAITGRRLEQPWSRPGCAAGSGVCKCAFAAGDGGSSELTVFIGDGRSDFCVSSRVDVLFAKDKLADYARSRAMPHHEFSDFHQVMARLAPLHERAARRAG